MINSIILGDKYVKLQLYINRLSGDSGVCLDQLISNFIVEIHIGKYMILDVIKHISIDDYVCNQVYLNT
jgi:hypothetical protein